MTSSPVTGRDARFTGGQTHVLLVLATRGESPATDWSAWYPMNEGQVRGVLRSLERRGLVDRVGFTRASFGRGQDARTFDLTPRGRDAVERIVGDDDAEELRDQLADGADR